MKSFGVHLFSQVGLQSEAIQIRLQLYTGFGPTDLGQLVLVPFLSFLSLKCVMIIIKTSPKGLLSSKQKDIEISFSRFFCVSSPWLVCCV